MDKVISALDETINQFRDTTPSDEAIKAVMESELKQLEDVLENTQTDISQSETGNRKEDSKNRD